MRTLRYTPPLDWPLLVGYYRERVLDGVELVEGASYARTFDVAGVRGALRVTPTEGEDALLLEIDAPDASPDDAVERRVRRMFDLDRDPAPVQRALGRDPRLGPLVAARPGLRVPCGWDPFETALRAILGQQVSVERARKLANELIERWGERLEASGSSHGLARLFPTPRVLARALDGARLGMPGARARALHALALAADEDPTLLAPFANVERTRARLRELPGVGPWTEEYVALRALRDPDAFPASDLGILRAFEEGGERPRPARVLERAEAWRPFRAYAAQHLWSA